MSRVVGKEDILSKIADTVRLRLKDAQSRISMSALQAEWQNIRPRAKDFTAVFSRPHWNIIAEVKRASPSKGDIAVHLEPLDIARDYLNNGAAALSVLTEPFYFKGSLEYLIAIRRRFPEAYILQKDFILDIYQVYEASLAGADAILIIVALLGEKQSQLIFDKAKEIGISALVEVHDAEELAIAKRIGAQLIGVNSRNLSTLSLSLDVTRSLIQSMPDGAIPIAESGITNADNLKELKNLGYKGFLVGTHFMQDGQPGKNLKRLLDDAGTY